mgnify:CR=1 FL=1
MKVEYVSSGVGYIKLGVSTGVISDGRRCMLVDTGLDDDAGRRIMKAISGEQLTVSGIFNTHSHADHHGGNTYILRRAKAKVYAPRGEAAVIENPILEPFYLWSASPPRELRAKFVLAKPSRVDYRVEAGSRIEEFGAEVIDLRGHSMMQAGLAVGKVLFAADSVMPPHVIEKYRVIYLYDVAEALKTLERLLKSDYSTYVLGHGGAVSSRDFKSYVLQNIQAIRSVEQVIEAEVTRPLEEHELARRIQEAFGLRVENLAELMLLKATLRAYITYMQQQGKLKVKAKGEVIVEPA